LIGQSENKQGFVLYFDWSIEQILSCLFWLVNQKTNKVSFCLFQWSMWWFTKKVKIH